MALAELSQWSHDRAEGSAVETPLVQSGRKLRWLPSTALGKWGLGLAAVGLALVLLPGAGIILSGLLGLAAVATSLVAIVRKHERSVLGIAPAVFGMVPVGLLVLIAVADLISGGAGTPSG